MSSDFILVIPTPNINHYIKRSHLKIKYNNLIQPYYINYTSVIIGLEIKNKEKDLNILSLISLLSTVGINGSNFVSIFADLNENSNYGDFKILTSTKESDNFSVKLKKGYFYLVINIFAGNQYNTYTINYNNNLGSVNIPFITSSNNVTSINGSVNNIIQEQNISGADISGNIITDTIYGDITTINNDLNYNIISKSGNYNYSGSEINTTNTNISYKINTFYVSRK